jgi:hypothetical protein
MQLATANCFVVLLMVVATAVGLAGGARHQEDHSQGAA